MAGQSLTVCGRAEWKFTGDQKPVVLIVPPELPCTGIKYPIAEADKITGCNPHDRETQLHGFHRRFDGVLRISHLSIDVDLSHFSLQFFIRDWIPDHSVIVVNRVRVSVNS